MSDHEKSVDAVTADELRNLALAAAETNVWGISVFDLRTRANELDPPGLPLPTEPGWYPNVSVRGGGYRPGAFRSSAAVYRWSVVNTEGLSVQLTDDRIEVSSPDTPRVFVDGDPCPAVGTRVVDKDGDKWWIAGGDTLVEDYGTYAWTDEIEKYGPMTEVLP